MTGSDWIRIVVRWLHILPAAVLVGGIIFQWWVLLPASREALDEEPREKLHGAALGRWKVLVMLSIILLLASGFYNFFTISLEKAKDQPLYHPLFGVKFLAALGFFFLTSVLGGRSTAFAGMRARPEKWLALNTALALVVVLAGGVLKNLR